MIQASISVLVMELGAPNSTAICEVMPKLGAPNLRSAEEADES